MSESQAEAQTVDESLAKLLYEDCYTTPWRDAPDLYRDIWLNKAAKVIAADWLAQREATLRSSIAAEIEAAAKSNPDCRCCRDAARIVRNGGFQ